jgi:hypothetical protein
MVFSLGPVTTEKAPIQGADYTYQPAVAKTPSLKRCILSARCWFMSCSEVFKNQGIYNKLLLRMKQFLGLPFTHGRFYRI